MADAKDVNLTAGKRSDITVVAENKNWRDYVAKELKSADSWNDNWGFLAGGAIEEGKEPEIKTKQQKIDDLE